MENVNVKNNTKCNYTTIKELSEKDKNKVYLQKQAKIQALYDLCVAFSDLKL